MIGIRQRDVIGSTKVIEADAYKVEKHGRLG
jgi:hypothetical protein